MSEILCFEHLTDFGISFIIVSGVTKLLSKAKAIVKVLKIDLVRTSFVILFKNLFLCYFHD